MVVFMKQVWFDKRCHLCTSASVLAEISVRSPQKIFICII